MKRRQRLTTNSKVYDGPEERIVRRLKQSVLAPYSRKPGDQLVGAVDVTRLADYVRTRRVEYLVMDRIHVSIG